MSNEEIPALSAKIDFLISKQKELSSKVDVLQAQFDQSKGALWLLKFAIWITGSIAALWIAIREIKL